MTHDATDIPAELRISFDAAPSVETRAVLGREINHVPRADGAGGRGSALLRYCTMGATGCVAGLSGMLVWQWLFVEALWVSDAWRGRGPNPLLPVRAAGARRWRRRPLCHLQMVRSLGAVHKRVGTNTLRRGAGVCWTWDMDMPDLPVIGKRCSRPGTPTR